MKMKIMLVVIILALLCGVPASAQQPSASEQTESAQSEPKPAKKKGLMGSIFGQDAKSKKREAQASDAEPQNVEAAPQVDEAQPQATPVETAEEGATETKPAKAAAEQQQGDAQQMSEEEAAIAPYYNNFFSTYRLGPEDVISVTVFQQERYSRANITIPPNGRISLPLIPGIAVSGKTTEEVAEIVRKRYDEYIIDPQVDVSLDKAVSYRYSVIGDVAQPGVKLLARRLTVREALAESGGILDTGDSSKVTVLRRQRDGTLMTIKVNVKKVLQGKIPDDTYLAPGDQIVVPGNKFKTIDKLLRVLPVISFARIFTGGW